MNCYDSYKYTQEWTLFQLDPSSKQIIKQINISSNPTAKLYELVLPDNTLDYGLYKAIFTVNTTSIEIFKFSSSNSTYFFIRPSGFYVFGIENGITSVLIGSDQRFYLNASNYSMDFDDVIDPSILNYKYYCQTIDSTNQSFGMQMIDLNTYKTNPSLLMNRNFTCFSSIGKRYFVIEFYLEKYKAILFMYFRLVSTCEWWKKFVYFTKRS
jgi:hypothetical protein